MRVTWVADALRDAGLDVYEDPGWKGRGRELTVVKGLVWHHTATSDRWLDGHVLALLRGGRPDVPGPLSQFGLERDGTWVMVADGRANHNGYGLWGNDSLGVEAYNSGIGEPWPTAQVSSYERGSAVICARLGLNPATQVKGHRETDPRRKIDPAGIDMNRARTSIDRLLHHTPPSEEDDMTPDQARKLDELHAQLVGKTDGNGRGRLMAWAARLERELIGEKVDGRGRIAAALARIEAKVGR